MFNAGTITGTGGTAINFAATAGAGPAILTIAPTSIINGNVLGTGADTFQLGSTGTGTFNVSNIGAAQQYQGFTTFNKIGTSTWTLTGAGAQNWTISQGTLIGDTNSLAGTSITDNAALVFDQSINGVHSGVIGGSGSLTKNGTGTVIFAADNTYLGGTTISAGVLQLGNGGTTGSIVGNVTDNAVLAINRSNAYVFAGVISGMGALQQNGTGTTNLTAVNGYTGATTVNGGTLQVDGSIASSSSTSVNAGGTLGGTGTVGNTDDQAAAPSRRAAARPGRHDRAGQPRVPAARSTWCRSIPRRRHSPMSRARRRSAARPSMRLRARQLCRQAIHHLMHRRRDQRHLRPRWSTPICRPTSPRR